MESHRTRVRAVLFWTDIGNYHHARNEAAHNFSGLDLDVFEITGKPEYAEFASGVASRKGYQVTQLGLDRLSTATQRRERMHEALRASGPNVVFAPGWSLAASHLTIEWCAQNDVACVLMSESTQDDKARSPYKEAIKRRIVGLTQAGFVGGRRHIEYLIQLGMPEHRIATGYDVVDNEHFWIGAQYARKVSLEHREQRGLPDHYFLCCCRFIDLKNLSRLIEAFHAYRIEALSSGREPWHLVLVGDGVLRSEIERRISNLELTGFVQLAGYIGYQELPVYYGLADAFVLASFSEPWGLVVNEAMAAGLPVLVSERCGSAADLVTEGRNGFTFNPYDTKGLSTLMTRISSDECDRTAMSASSRENIAQWEPKRFASGLKAAAQIALNAPRKSLSAIDRILLGRLAAR